MTIRNLDAAFNPKSIAVIGASSSEGSVGKVVMDNIAEAGFKGDVWPVNPKYDEVEGMRCYRKISALPAAPDLSVIMTPPKTVPKLIQELSDLGSRAAIVLTAGLNDENGLRQQMLDAAQPNLFRIFGPNTLGLLTPGIGLNASFSHMAAKPGKLALLSQSGAIVTTLIDWAADKSFGFSHLISLGDMVDVDVADCLDMLASDSETSAILVYLESVPNPRKFMSAARAAARVKPVIAIKAGRHEEGAKAAATHTGALSGADRVVDAAIRRAGVLRVRDLDELFVAAETIAQFPPLKNPHVGIVTNGGGAGVLAIDQLIDEKSQLAQLSDKTISDLNAVLPDTWSHSNPVDIIGDAPPERYVAAMNAVAEDDGVEAILVMNCPTALASPIDAAKGIAGMVDNGTLNGKPVFACWLGEHKAYEARQELQKAGIASFETPGEAARAISFLSRWTRLQDSLTRVPNSHTVESQSSETLVSEILAQVGAEDRDMLTEREAKLVVGAYGIPVPEIVVAQDVDEVHHMAAQMLADHSSIVVKLLAREISHKSDIGGVVLNLPTADAAVDAAKKIEERVYAAQPDAEIDGFAIQPMVKWKGAHELIIGMNSDPIFGPALLFGSGGTAVEVIEDTAIALPPLDDVLGRDLISRTQISKLLKGYRDQPAADEEAILSALNGVSQLIVDFPCITGIDINPLLANEDGVVALDARIEIDPKRVSERGPNADLAIRPYPTGWRKQLTLPNKKPVHLRPIRPDDFSLYPAFFEQTSKDDLRLRMISPRAATSEVTLKRFTQLDYDREMAFVAIVDGQDELGGVSRISADPDHEVAEFAVLVRTDMQGQGLGLALLEHLITYAKADGIAQLHGTVLKENTKMLAMCKELGFDIEAGETGASTVEVKLALR